MQLDQLAEKLQAYLRIVQPSIDEAEYIKSFCRAASGYITTTYRYNILDKPVTYLTLFTQAQSIRVFLPEIPIKKDTIVVLKSDGSQELTDFDIIGGAIYFKEPILLDSSPYTIQYSSGVDTSSLDFIGDVEHCVQLAAWLYRTADKGLEGIDQISTGVKENTKMFEGIPQNITTYFESRQPIRL